MVIPGTSHTKPNFESSFKFLTNEEINFSLGVLRVSISHTELKIHFLSFLNFASRSAEGNDWYLWDKRPQKRTVATVLPVSSLSSLGAQGIN